MRRFGICRLVLFSIVTCILAGCGGASSIEPGIPKDLDAVPKDFDPGGDAIPDMTGKAAKPKAK